VVVLEAGLVRLSIFLRVQAAAAVSAAAAMASRHGRPPA